MQPASAAGHPTHGRRARARAGALTLLALALPACAGETTPSDKPPPTGSDLGAPPPGSRPDLAEVVAPKDDPQLTQRTVDYGLALRSASLKLTGDLPSLDEMRGLLAAADQKSSYEARIDAYLADKRFVPQLIALFRNSFKLGGKVGDLPSFETAPVFAARLVVEGRPITDLFTASSATCPTWSDDKGFQDGECKNGVAQHAGVLSDPGVQAQFYSNLAFRRVRWIQETFDCRKFPAEYSKAPMQMGNGVYSSPWPFKSITGGDGAPIDFHDAKSVVCANCHSTMNHLAPLFARFDGKGQWQMGIQVVTPIKDQPKSKLTDWLPPGEDTAWRFGQAVSDLPALGQAMARDPGVHACLSTRVYDWAMSKDDPVTDLATVPDSIIAPYTKTLLDSRFDLKRVIRQAFTSDDFVRF